MTFNIEALAQALGDEQWLARINPPYKEQTLHHQLLTSTKVSNPTAKKSFGFGVTATKQQRLPTKRFYLDSATFAANSIKYIKEWNDPNLPSLERLQIMQKQVVTAALIVAGDETNPYITIVTNPSITKLDIQDEDNIGAPFWSDILSEELAYKIGVPYNRPSHLVAAGTGWATRTDEISSREGLIHKIQPVLLHPAERFGTRQEGVSHVLFLPALICPPVGFFWPAKTTYSEFVASIKAMNGTAYRSFLTMLELCRSIIEPWFEKVNASAKHFRFRMQSAQPLINALPTKDNPIPEGIEDESLLDPILELVDQLLWSFYEDRVLTDCESKESKTNASSQLHYFLRYGRKSFPESLKSVYGSRIPFLIYFLRPRWMMEVDHGALFSDEYYQAQWIQSYHPVKVPVIEDDSYEPVMIRTKLELAVEKETEIKPKVTTITRHSDLKEIAKKIPEPEAPKAPPQQEEEKRLIPAVLIRNVCPNYDLANLSRCFVNGIRNVHAGEEPEVVSCHYDSKRKGTGTVFLEFKALRHARLALHLDGIQVGARIVSVELLQPGANVPAIDLKPQTITPPTTAKGGNDDKYKTELCTRWESKGSCWFGEDCGFAHGVLDLRLQHSTKLHPEHCLYVRNIVRNYPADSVMHFIRKNFEQSVHASPDFTAIHVRGRLGDALVAFKNSAQASVARQILDGISLVNRKLEIYNWRPEYQRAFVAYFKEDRDIPIHVANFAVPKVATSDGNSITNSVETKEQSRMEERLQQLLLESQKEVKALREGKQNQDELLRLLSESLYSMKLGLSTAMSEIDSMKLGFSTALSSIDSVMKQMANLQEVQAKLSPKTMSLSSPSNSSDGDDVDAEIQREIERLQKMIKKSNPEGSGRSEPLPFPPQTIRQVQGNQSYSSALERSFQLS